MTSLSKVHDFRYFVGANTVSYASIEKIRITEITKTDKQNICKAATEGISPRWKMSFQNSGKHGQYECNNIQGTIVSHYTF